MPEKVRTGWAAMPLRRRLVLGLLAVMAATMVVVAGATFLALRSWMVDQIDTNLMAGKSSVVGDHDDSRNLSADAIQPWTTAGATLVLISPNGTATSLANGSGPGEPSTKTYSASDADTLASVPTASHSGPVTVTLDSLGTSRAVAVPLVNQNTGQRYVVIAVIPTSRATEVASRLLLVEIIAMALALVFAGIVAAWFIRRSLRPLREVTRTATEVAELSLERGDVTIPARVPNPIPTTEVGQVGLAVNAMLDHVEQSLQTRADTEDRLRRFVSDAGHELRTPLAAVRGYAELMRRGAGTDPAQSRHAAERIEAAGSRMGMLVEDLLLLASLDEQRPLAHDAVDLRGLIEEAVAEAATAGPTHTWAVEDGLDQVVVVGDGVRLHQAVGNLLANARAHTPTGTSVSVSVAEVGTDAVIEVSDDGPGFPADLLPRVTERFARGDSSRSRATGGSGLGLSIVKAVAESHGGTITVGNGDSGGAVIRITLPIAGPDGDPADSDPVREGRDSDGLTVPPAGEVVVESFAGPAPSDAVTSHQLS